MQTKAELKKRNRELASFTTLLMIIAIASIVMVAYLSAENMTLQPDCSDKADPNCVLKDPNRFVYGYPTIEDRVIDMSSIDPSCILGTADYTNNGGNIWVDISPHCVKVVKHTFKREEIA